MSAPLVEVQDLAKIFDTVESIKWRGFRDSDGAPQYSVWSADASRTGRWINPQTPPPVPPKDAFDTRVIVTKATDFIDQYNNLVANYLEDKVSFDCNRFDAFKKAMETLETYTIEQWANGQFKTSDEREEAFHQVRGARMFKMQLTRLIENMAVSKAQAERREQIARSTRTLDS